MSYLDCRNACADHVCETLCLENFVYCAEDCPCNLNCLDGCEGCDSPFCVCRNPEEDEDTLKCIKEAIDEQVKCQLLCSPSDDDCYSKCFDEFLMAKENCPCMSNCANGCPCPSYSCGGSVGDSHSLPLLVLSDQGSNKLSYILTPEESIVENVVINTPSERYLERVGFGTLNGEHYIFGGTTSSRKIAKVVGCSFVEQSSQLIFDFDHYPGAIMTIESGRKILLCFGTSSAKTCEIFDGEKSEETFSTTNNHRYGCLANYKNYPLAIEGSPAGTTEIMKENGWEASIKLNINVLRSHVCFSVDDAVIALMGFDANSHDNLNVHLLKDDQWKIIGQTSTYQNLASVFNLLDKFYVISGQSYGSLVAQRFNWNGESVTDPEVIHTHQHEFYRPALFAVQSSSFCVV